MNDFIRFRVDAFNRVAIAVLVLVFTGIFAACLLLDGETRWIGVAAAASILALIAMHMRCASVCLTPSGLRVGAGLYQRFVPTADLTAISTSPFDRRLRWRRNGIGFPGFALGWFSAGDKRVVFAAAGASGNTVRIRLRGDFDLLVGVADRDGLLRTLRTQFPSLADQNPPPSRR